jgi:hypothetical protein
VLAIVSLFFFCGSVTPQSLTAYEGRWVWKEAARRNQPQTQFTVVINRTGDKVSGTYSVDQFINGEWQGEDGNQTPFAGRLNRRRIEIEFDPNATVPGYQENVSYKPPTDGRKPSLAVLTLQGRTLKWRLLTGSIEGVPGVVGLKRQPRPRR